MASQLETCARLCRVSLFVGVVACLSGAAVASADTVYLKNGRTMRATSVQVLEDEGRVVLQQGPNRVVIPLAIVDRIVEDEKTSEVLEPGKAERPAEAPAPPAEEAQKEGEAGAEGGAAEGEAAEVPPEETRAYWQDKVRAIQDEQAQLQETITTLRREERAFLFSHRSTAETKAKIKTAQDRIRELGQEMTALRREARRQGIPPGWLRVGNTRTGGDQGR